MTPIVTLREALADPQALGGVIDGDSWFAWRVLLLAVVGEELLPDERALFKVLTGREHEAGFRVEEFVGVIGRRGGKTRAIAVLASYIAALCQHPALVPGETGVLLIIAPDQRQADVCLSYIDAIFRGSPLLSQLIEARTARTLRLNNNVILEVRASDFRRLRGPTYICVIGDEIAGWMTSESSSSNPDSEILTSVRPALATTGGPLILISSPYARKGELWKLYHRHYGAAGDPAILVAQGASRQLNPILPQAVVDRAMERDSASASAEYMAEFRTDVEGFISVDAVQACVATGIREHAPRGGGAGYAAFCDPSGGSSDSMTLAVAHRDGDSVILDCVREIRPPFSPEAVCEEFAQVLKSYRISRVTGDRYAGEWVPEAFRRHCIRYEPAAQFKSALYLNLLPLINSRRVSLLDHPRLISQLTSLERRTARGGKDSIDHPPNQHDDLANAAAGALTSSAAPRRRILTSTFSCGYATGRPAHHPLYEVTADGMIEIDRATGLPLERQRVRVVRVDEHGRPLTPDQAAQLRHRRLAQPRGAPT